MSISPTFVPNLPLRLATEADQVQLAVLYRSSRRDLLTLPLPEPMLTQFISQQQQFHDKGITQHYPNAQTMVLEQNGTLVARIIFSTNTENLHLIDMIVLPILQRRGLGRQLLRYLLDLADENQQWVSLRVMKNNEAARQLYAGHGFQLSGQDELAEYLQRPATTGKPAQDTGKVAQAATMAAPQPIAGHA